MQDEREKFAKAQDAELMVSPIGQLRAFAEQQTKFAERAQELNNNLLYPMNSCGHEITQAARLGNEAMNLTSLSKRQYARARREYVVFLRTICDETFREIGQRLGIGAPVVWEMFQRGRAEADGTWGMGC